MEFRKFYEPQPCKFIDGKGSFVNLNILVKNFYSSLDLSLERVGIVVALDLNDNKETRIRIKESELKYVRKRKFDLDCLKIGERYHFAGNIYTKNIPVNSLGFMPKDSSIVGFLGFKPINKRPNLISF